MADLGTLDYYGRGNSDAYAINNNGRVVGRTQLAVNGNYHAFLTEDAKSILQSLGSDLGTLPGGTTSYAYGVNSSDQVVGKSTVSGGAYHAFLFCNGQMYDLNNLVPITSGWVFTVAYGINDSGQIVGVGTHTINGQPLTRGFILNP